MNKKFNIIMFFAVIFQLAYPVAINAQEVIDNSTESNTASVRNVAANVQLHVVDQDGKPLGGVKYYVYDADGTLITPTPIESDSDGIVETTRGAGNYYLIQAEDYSDKDGNYITDTQKHEFTVTTDDNGQVVNAGTSILTLDTNPKYHVNKTVTSSSPSGLVPGATLTYSVKITNDGYVEMNGSQPAYVPVHDNIMEKLPSWLTIQSEDCFGQGCKGQLSDGTAEVWSAGGQEFSYTLKVADTIPSDVKSLDNIANIGNSAIDTCSDEGNTCSSVSESVIPTKPLEVTKTVADAGGNGINHMEDATYTITITNPDEYATQTNIPVHDSLVENQLSWFKYDNDVKVTGASITGNLGDGNLVINSLAPGASATITYTMTAGTIPPVGQTPASLVNVVTVDGTQKDTCKEGTDGCAKAELGINHVLPTNTEIYKSVKDENNNKVAEVGETLDYTIRLVNNDNEPLQSKIAFHDSLLENLPSYVTYNDDFIATASKGNDSYTGDVTKGNLVFDQIDNNETITITYSLTLNALPNDGSTELLNMAKVSTQESTGENSAEATINLDIAKANVSLNKVDQDGKALEGVKFKISNNDISAGVPVQELTTDADGNITFTDLPVGEYTVKETQPLAGYKINKTEYPVTIKVADDGKTIKVNNGEPIVNERMEGDYDVTKTAVSNNPNGLVEGAIIDYTIDIDAYTAGVESDVPIHDSLLENLPSWLTLVEGSNYINQSQVSGDITKGTATIDKIGPGVPTQYVYQLKVGAVPADVKSIDNIFTIGENLPTGNSCPKNDPQCSKATMDRIDGTISLHKVDQDGNPLADAEFTITDSKGNEIETLTTDGEGNATSKSLLGGEYTVTETKAPSDYLLDDTVYPVTIKDKQVDVKVNDGKDIVNQIKQGTISLHKVDQDGKDLAGAEFTIIDQDGKEVETITTDSKGNATSNLLPVGAYSITETKAPNGYLLDDTSYKVTIKEDQEDVKVNNGNDIVNQIKQGTISLHKVDQDGKDLAGAEFTITNSEGTKVQTLTTDSKGNATSDLLPAGEYEVIETKAPTNYVLDNTKYTATIREDQEDVKLNNGKDIVNNINQGTISLHKVDQDGKDLAGAEFTIFDADNNVVGTVKSGKDGLATSKKLNAGNYTVKETRAPKGYKVNTQVFKATIKTNNQAVKLNGGKGIVNELIVTPEEPTKPVKPTNPSDNGVDTDKDGVTDFEEEKNGTNPELTDTDGDGLTDSEEITYGTDPRVSDTDKDGVSDSEELSKRTNPLVNDKEIQNTGSIYQLAIIGEMIVVLIGLLVYRRQM